MLPPYNLNNDELKQMVAQALKGTIYEQELSPAKKATAMNKSQSAKLIEASDSRFKEAIQDAKLMPTMREIKYLFEKLVGEKFEKEMRPDVRQMNEDLNQVHPSGRKSPPLLEKPKTGGIVKSIPMRSQTQRQMSEYDNLSKKKLLEFADDIEK